MLGFTSYRDWTGAGVVGGSQQQPQQHHLGGAGLGVPQQQLSVVTTVWGVTTSTQSGPGAPGGGGYPLQVVPGQQSQQVGGYGVGPSTASGKVPPQAAANAAGTAAYHQHGPPPPVGYRQNVPPG
ncbi:unnamed protein product [Acanthoscelides obtectus]|uniref:Uncharacterized protein n=1 Tax=Acanthoscelides obtectus TaxID=200917 RepID=A0A9P0NZX9_ACAOB|nr:unnamed protein product [Acanthoscelides obtectus]CAK1633957.1 hypothetical protein AOBTE_LOCUS8509 [Acanthoscelides obtectus]